MDVMSLLKFVTVLRFEYKRLCPYMKLLSKYQAQDESMLIYFVNSFKKNTVKMLAVCYKKVSNPL